jgi:hypothetical protein
VVADVGVVPFASLLPLLPMEATTADRLELEVGRRATPGVVGVTDDDPLTG